LPEDVSEIKAETQKYSLLKMHKTQFHLNREVTGGETDVPVGTGDLSPAHAHSIPSIVHPTFLDIEMLLSR